MLRLALLCLLVSSFSQAKLINLPFTDNEVCCGDLGCFADNGPFFTFDRPLSTAPDCSIVSTTELRFNSRDVPVSSGSPILDPYRLQSITQSNFKVERDTKILIHGFTDNYDWPWWKDMIKNLLEEGDFNVIRLNWSSGNKPPYYQATANTRLAGAYVGKFINVLKDELGYSPSKVHIIGHSLGAHIAGYAGERVNKVGRISGVDPAGLYFTNLDIVARLDPTDAVVVDTLIADGEPVWSLGMGSPQPMGHLNFYMNGGVKQPGCETYLTTSALLHGPTVNSTSYDLVATGAQSFYQTIGCNHWRALFLYIESVPKSNCAMKAYMCDKFETYLDGKCFSCARGRCSNAGYHANLSLAEPKVVKNFQVATTAKPPFCKRAYKLSFKLEKESARSDAHSERGKMYTIIQGNQGTSARIPLTANEIDFVPGTEKSFLLHESKELGKIQLVRIFWESEFSISNAINWLLHGRHIYIDGDVTIEDENEKVTVLRSSLTNKIEDLKEWIVYSTEA